MRNNLVLMYETQNKENPLTETQKLFTYIDGVEKEKYNVANAISEYGVVMNIQNYLLYSRLQHFNTTCVDGFKEVCGIDKFKELFVTDPGKLYKEIVDYIRSNSLEGAL